MAEYIVELPNTPATFEWLRQFVDNWLIDWQTLDTIDVAFKDPIDAEIAVHAFASHVN